MATSWSRGRRRLCHRIVEIPAPSMLIEFGSMAVGSGRIDLEFALEIFRRSASISVPSPLFGHLLDVGRFRAIIDLLIVAVKMRGG